MIEGLKESLQLIHHEIIKLQMIMIGEEWDKESEGYSNGLDRALELINNRLKNEKNDSS